MPMRIGARTKPWYSNFHSSLVAAAGPLTTTGDSAGATSVDVGEASIVWAWTTPAHNKPTKGNDNEPVRIEQFFSCGRLVECQYGRRCAVGRLTQIARLPDARDTVGRELLGLFFSVLEGGKPVSDDGQCRRRHHHDEEALVSDGFGEVTAHHPGRHHA